MVAKDLLIAVLQSGAKAIDPPPPPLTKATATEPVQLKDTEVDEPGVETPSPATAPNTSTTQSTTTDDDDDDDENINLFHYTTLDSAGIADNGVINGQQGRGPRSNEFGVFLTDLSADIVNTGSAEQLSLALFNNPSNCKDFFIEFAVDAGEVDRLGPLYTTEAYGPGWSEYLWSAEIALFTVIDSGQLAWTC